MREVTSSGVWQGDMYFYIYSVVQPTSFIICKDDQELSDCAWIPISKFIESSKFSPLTEQIILGLKDTLPYKIKENDPRAQEKLAKFKDSVLVSKQFKQKTGKLLFQHFHAIERHQFTKF